MKIISWISLIFIIFNNLKAWEMKGFTNEINISNINSYKIWCFKNNEWDNNFYGNLQNIEGGEACWINNPININFLENNITYNWHEGWNFVTPVYQNWNLNEKFRNNVLIGWRYKNNKWEVYNAKVLNKNINNFNTLNIKEGAFFYIKNIYVKINNLPLFCSQGDCSKIILNDSNYNFFIKVPQNINIKIAVSLKRYSNNSIYKFAMGPFKIIDNTINTSIPFCVDKDDSGSCEEINNQTEKIMVYENPYLKIDINKLANHFNKTLPNTNENFFIKLYIEGFYLPNFIKDSFGTLGIENFGTWVSLKNSSRIQFEMEIK